MSTVAQKLGIKPGNSIAVAGLGAAEAVALIGELPEGATVSERGDSVVDQLIVAADGLASLPGMLLGSWDQIAAGGRLWVWYRKGASRGASRGGEEALHRDSLQAVLAEQGMDGVTLISIDDTWSSMRVKQL